MKFHLVTPMPQDPSHSMIFSCRWPLLTSLILQYFSLTFNSYFSFNLKLFILFDAYVLINFRLFWCLWLRV